jgi:predicted nucleotidyltransferase
MGGGGGGSGATYFPSKPSKLQHLIRETHERTEQQRSEADINLYLQQLLAKLTDRDPEKTKTYLDEIVSVLHDYQEVDRLLFGGSVAKHTYVDGLSDVDALVVLNRDDLQGKSPQEVLNIFFDSLQGELTRDKVKDLKQGRLGVTVDYEDGTEIQLLPAIKRGKEILIADSNGADWKSINPKVFQRELSKANERLNRALVPTIKIMKSTLSGLPDEVRPSGYHIEALCLDLTKGYKGPKTPKSLLQHVMLGAASRVLKPITDVTNQSRYVDEYLGKPNSEQRVRLSRELAGISRRINAATTADRWNEIIQG